MIERTLRVLSVDDSCDVAEISQRLFSREADMEGVGVLASADDLVEEVRGRRADVVVLDLGMPGRDPLEALRELVEQTGCCVVVLSGDDRPGTVDGAIEAGASGFISKHASPREVVEAVRRATRGECPLPGR